MSQPIDPGQTVVNDYFQKGIKEGKSLVIDYERMGDKKVPSIAQRELKWYEKMRENSTVVDNILSLIGVEDTTSLKKVVKVCIEKGIYNPKFYPLIRTHNKNHFKIIKPEDEAAVTGFFQKGVRLQEELQFKDAKKEFEALVHINPFDDQALTHLGETYYELSRLDNPSWNLRHAADCFSEAIQWNPENRQAHGGLANVLHDQGGNTEVIDKTSRHEGALALKEQQRFDEAKFILNKAIEIDPKDEIAYYLLGIILWHQGEHSKAELSFRRALEFNIFNTSVHYALEGALTNQGKHEEAKISRLHGDSITLLRLGKYKEAEEVAREALSLNKKNDTSQAILKAITS